MITFIDAVSRQVLDSVVVGGVPNPVVFSADGQTAYGGDQANDVILVIDVASRRVADTRPVR
jgi:DNA-binding beta-propeller fold protein YncE